MMTDAERVQKLFISPGWRPNTKKDEIARLAELGMSGGEIARVVGQTRNQVAGVCNRLGIKLRGRAFAYGKWKRTKKKS